MHLFTQECFIHQRMRTVALQQDAMLREQISSEVSVYATELSVFVDETGSDARNKHGYCIRGKIKQFSSDGNESQQSHACPQLDYWMCRPSATGEVFYNNKLLFASPPPTTLDAW